MCGIALVVSDSTTLWPEAGQSPQSMRFSRQEYWSGLPCPPSGDLPDLGIKPMPLTSPALAAGSLPLMTPAKPPKAFTLALFHWCCLKAREESK